MGGHKPTPTEDPPQRGPNPMDFVTPSEFIDLPSRGRYPDGHPLKGSDTLEIRHMTAKDEDILTSRSLLRKGVAIERLIENLLVDKSISAQHLYIGDRNAIIIHARASAYGYEYKTSVTCPACGENSKFKFDLTEFEIYHGDDIEETGIEDLGDGTFKVILPLSQIEAVIRPLMGVDESFMMKKNKGKDVLENLVTRQMKRFVVSFNGYDDDNTVNHVCDNMVATDSKHLRGCFQLISPDIKLSDNFVCRHCGHEEVMSVPFGADFFWPE